MLKVRVLLFTLLLAGAAWAQLTVKSNSGNWQDQHCGGVTLDYDDATLIAPIFEDPAGSGIYTVYWATRDQATPDLTQISLHIGLIGLAR